MKKEEIKRYEWLFSKEFSDDDGCYDIHYILDTSRGIVTKQIEKRIKFTTEDKEHLIDDE